MKPNVLKRYKKGIKKNLKIKRKIYLMPLLHKYTKKVFNFQKLRKRKVKLTKFKETYKNKKANFEKLVMKQLQKIRNKNKKLKKISKKNILLTQAKVKRIKHNQILKNANILTKLSKRHTVWKNLLNIIKDAQSQRIKRKKKLKKKVRHFFNIVKHTHKYLIIVLNCSNINLKLELNYKQDDIF